ncbi:hypothetical protein SUGI_0727570 [Cryptomeria japonica]|nr:hypothetical protein SUGI_0727570 [Cryptomeria japonica]
MLNTTDLIIPLFYHIDPTHVRYPEGNDSPYKQSFLKHESHRDRYTEKEVKGPKDALKEICKRSGWSTDLTGE